MRSRSERTSVRHSRSHGRDHPAIRAMPCSSAPGQEPRHQVVQHDPKAAVNPGIQGADGPGLPDVEQPEQGETQDDPDPARRRGGHGDQEANHLVPDDGPGVPPPEIPGCGPAGPDPDQGRQHHRPQVPGQRQAGQGQVEGDRRQGPGRARGPGRQPGPQAEGDPVPGPAPVKPGPGHLRRRSGHSRSAPGETRPRPGANSAAPCPRGYDR